MHRIPLRHIQYGPPSWFVCINVLNDLSLPPSASLNESAVIKLRNGLAEGRAVAVDDDMAELGTVTVHHYYRRGYSGISNAQHSTIRTCRLAFGV